MRSHKHSIPRTQPSSISTMYDRMRRIIMLLCNDSHGFDQHSLQADRLPGGGIHFRCSCGTDQVLHKGDDGWLTLNLMLPRKRKR